MDFRETELARTIPDAYQVEEAPLAELADVFLVIQPEQPVFQRRRVVAFCPFLVSLSVWGH